jgi:hypothetical protein
MPLLLFEISTIGETKKVKKRGPAILHPFLEILSFKQIHTCIYVFVSIVKFIILFVWFHILELPKIIGTINCFGSFFSRPKSIHGYVSTKDSG